MKFQKRTLIYAVGLIVIFTLLISLSTQASAEGSISHTNSKFIKGHTNIYFFWQEGCPHCALEELFLKDLSNKYPINIYSFEIRNNRSNQKLYLEACGKFGLKQFATPTTFIGSEQVVGFVNDSYFRDQIRANIINCVAYGCEDKLYYLFKNFSPTVNFQHNNLSYYCSGESSCSINSSNLLELGGSMKRNESNNSDFIVVPILGKIKVSKISLPIFTIVIAGLDSFNPCAMWVLTFLLTLLIYSESKKKMLFVGLVFVFASAFIYFLFMTAWLNLFLFIGYTYLLRILVGSVAVLMAIVDLKDSFWFKKGLSFTIPDSVKPKLFKKMREIVKDVKHYEIISLSVIVGIITLAVTANLVEFACTAGFPAIYTRVLTMRHLPTLTYYLYLIFYNIIYVIPLFIIVLVFSLTLGAHKFSERSGRIMKFVGGLLMLILGLLLIFRPEMLILR